MSGLLQSGLFFAVTGTENGHDRFAIACFRGGKRDSEEVGKDK